MFIKQVSVFLENTKGTLREVTQLLGENKINLLALSVADTSGFGIIRLIVKSGDIDKTLSILRDSGNIARVNDVVCVRIPHKPLGLSEVLAVLEDNDISVEYSYSFCRSTIDDAVIILRPSDKVKCVDALTKEGISLVTHDEVDTF
ncbi:MAG: ACT domain-containing protein [Ruminococcaceae bacterium]|nr:ACT domain-containing protein [Oscillospiraceae bacterium]